MKYSIVEKIIFDSDSNWIVCRDNDSVLIEKKLSRTASQILAILLANYGELVERDYLLSEVWELAVIMVLTLHLISTSVY